MDIKGGACAALIVEPRKLAEDKATNPLKHPTQLERGKGALQRLGGCEAVL